MDIHLKNKTVFILTGSVYTVMEQQSKYPVRLVMQCTACNNAQFVDVIVETDTTVDCVKCAKPVTLLWRTIPMHVQQEIINRSKPGPPKKGTDEITSTT